MGEDLPARGLVGTGDPLGVDRHDDALVAELLRRLGDEVGVLHGGGVDADLVGAREQERAHIGNIPHPAADGERHEAGFRRAAHHVEQGATRLVARGDVEEAEFVGAGRIVGLGRFNRITGIAQLEELHALHDAPVLHVEAGDDAGLEHA